MYREVTSVPPMGMIDDIASVSLCISQSVINNSIINSKIESKRLQFGPDKCYQIHVGKNKHLWPSLKVHNNVMKHVDSVVYLGDTVSGQGPNNLTVEKRKNASIGTISEIMSILSQVSLGQHYFTI